MAKTKQAAGTIEAWLRSMPGPMSSDSPQNVLRKAHERYSATCAEPVELGFFTDHLWSRGVVPEQVGALFYLKLPGKDRQWADKRRDSPTRIAG